MKAGMTKNSAGIGGKIEDIPCMGGFVTSTGGSREQRLLDRNYLKAAHKVADKEARDALTNLPELDISKPLQVF